VLCDAASIPAGCDTQPASSASAATVTASNAPPAAVRLRAVTEPAAAQLRA
jgi:hypothetical protein